MFSTVTEVTFYISLLQVVFHCIKAFNVDVTESPVTMQNSTEDEFFGKSEAFVNCPKFLLDPDEFVMYPNATVYVMDYNMSYTEESYLLHGGGLMVCIPMEDESENSTDTSDINALHQITVIGIGVSMVCLLIHLILFAMVPDLQNLAGCNMALLCVSLFLSYLLMSVILAGGVYQHRVACFVVAGMTQFFLMSSFTWMSVIAFDVFRLIHQATSNLRTASKDFDAKKFICNNVVAWGTALIFSAAAMIADNIEGVPINIQPQFDVMCWFNQKQALLVFFGGPAFTLFCINFILFGISAYRIFVTKKIFLDRLKSCPDTQCKLKKSYAMYFRLAIIVGITWITGALAPLANVLWLWYLFAALNAFQGLFIFVAFTCTSKVRKYFCAKISKKRIVRKNPTIKLVHLPFVQRVLGSNTNKEHACS